MIMYFTPSKNKSQEWISTREAIPEDGQFVLTLTSNGICATERFYYDEYVADCPDGVYGPAQQWGDSEREVLYWIPIPSVVGLEGFKPSNYMTVLEDRATRKENSNG